MSTRRFTNHSDGIDTRQMQFVSRLLNQPQSKFSKGGGSPEPIPQEQSASKQIMATQLKLDPIALIPHNATMSSKNSDLEQTLIPAASGGGASHHMPFDIAYMPNGPVAVATILEEDTSTIHKQSQEFKLELNKSFRNMLVAPPKQLFATDIFKTRNQKFAFTDASPFTPTMLHANQKQIQYQNNLEQLGAMTISKYQPKPKLQAFGAENWRRMGEQEGNGVGAIDLGHYNIRDFDLPATRKFEPARLQYNNVYKPKGPRHHTSAHVQSIGSPRRARMTSPIKITSITKSQIQRDSIDEQQQFLNNLLAPDVTEKAKKVEPGPRKFATSRLRGTLVKNEMEGGPYSPLPVPRNESSPKDESDDESRRVLGQTLDGVGDQNSAKGAKDITAKKVQRNQQNGTVTSFREIASNYTLNMESSHQDAERKRESTKASQALANAFDQRSSETPEDDGKFRGKRIGSREQSQLQQTLRTNQDYYQTMRFPKIKTVYVPLGQGPPKTPRDFPAGRRAGATGQTPARLAFQSTKSGHQRWKTPITNRMANDTTDGSTIMNSTLRSSRRSSVINQFDSIQHQANQAIMQFPRSYHRSPDVHPSRHTQQPSKERKHKHSKIPSFNFNFGVEANQTQNIGQSLAMHGSSSDNTKTIHIIRHAGDRKQIHMQEIGAHGGSPGEAAGKFAVNQPVLLQARQVSNENDIVGMRQIEDSEAPGVFTSAGSPNGVMSPVSFMESNQNLVGKQKGGEVPASDRAGSADAEETRSLGGGNMIDDSMSLRHIQNNDWSTHQKLAQLQGDTRTPTHSTTAAQTPNLQQFPARAPGAGQYPQTLGMASSPRGANQSSNFYLDIEKQPFLTLDYELQAQQQIRELQKRIRIKKEQVKKQIRENGHQLVIMEENLELKQKLQKVAQQIDNSCSNPPLNQDQSETRADQMKIQAEEKPQRHEYVEGFTSWQPSVLAADAGKKDESQQVDFGPKRLVKPVLTERLLDGSNDISVDDPTPGSLKPTFALQIMKKQMMPQSAIFKAMSASPEKPQPQKRSPFKNSRSSPLHAEDHQKKELDAAEAHRIHQNNWKIEHRISNLYKKQVRSDLSRDKQIAEESIQLVRSQTQVDAEDAQELRSQNRKLAATIRKYKAFVDNFDAEEDEESRQMTDEQFDGQSQRTPSRVKDRGAADAGPTQNTQNTQKSRGSSRTGAVSRSGRGSTMKRPKTNTTQNPRQQTVSNINTRQSDKVSQWSHYASKTIDAGKLGKLVYHTRAACKRGERPLDFILNVLENVKLYLGCQKAIFIPVDPRLVHAVTGQSKKQARQQIAQNVHELDFHDEHSQESRKLTAICQGPEELSEPIFTSVSDPDVAPIALQGERVAILFKFCRAGAPLSFVIQAELGRGLQKQQAPTSGKADGSPAPTSKKQQTMKKFNRTELVALRGVLQSVQLKLENIMHVAKKRLMANEQQRSIAMVQHMSRCTTLRGLMREMNSHLLAFLGFGDINILFHDEEKGQLYTITFGDEEEKKSQFAARLKAAKSEKEREDIRDEESMQDVTLNEQQMIFYPTHLGLTSRAFHQQKAIAINDFGTNPKRVEFVSAVDNPRGVKAIQNYLVGILRREDSSTNGLVQLFNSPNPILAYDRRRLESLARFFGGCIENIESSTKKLTTMLAVEGGGQPATEAVEEGWAAVADDGTFTDLGKALASADAELARDLTIINDIDKAIQ